MKLADKLKALRAIDSGCKKHPKYQAKRKPTADCQDCREMWKARQALRDG
jgi:hypothetical protein